MLRKVELERLNKAEIQTGEENSHFILPFVLSMGY
jgi:hypothetical protein